MFDSETFKIGIAVPYCKTAHKLAKISVQYNENLTSSQYQKCLEDCIVVKGVNCINEFLDHALSFKGEVKRVDIKTINYNLLMIAHNGNGYNTYVFLNILPQWRRVVHMIKNGAGIISLKIFNGYVDKNNKIPQYVHFRCGRVHINNNLRNIGLSYKLQPCLLKQELDHDEI